MTTLALARGQAAWPARPRVRYAAVAGDDAAMTAPWARLAEAAIDDNAFFHPDFAVPAAQALVADIRLATIAAGDRLLAAAPFTAARLGGIAPAVRLWSHPYGPLGTPLIAADAPGDTAAALVEGLTDGGRLTLIVPDLPLDGAVAAALRAAARARGRPVAVLSERRRARLQLAGAGGFDAAQRLSQHRRREYARQLRRLGEWADVRMEAALLPADAAAAFQTFLALEAAGWKGSDGTALASRAAMAAFATAAVTGLAKRGAVRIDTLRVDDRAAASLVSLLAGGTAFTWKIAYDEGFARYSPGVQVMIAALNALANEHRMLSIDSCAAPDHPMVDPLFRSSMPMGTLVIGPRSGGAAYRLGLAAARAEAAGRKAVRAMRRRRR